MIKTEGASTHLRGDTPTLFIELVFLLHTFLERLEADMSKDDAEKALAIVGKLAVLDEDELVDRFEEIVEEFKSDTRL